jgi:hypothetical protein
MLDNKRTKKTTTSHTPDALQAEFQYLRDVYGEIRAEIRNDEQKIISNLNYTLIGAGIVVTVSSFIANNQQYYLFLVLPFLFFVLAFSNFENLGIAREGNYLRHVVYPRMREIIVLLGNCSHDFGVNVLDWENYWLRNNFPTLLRLPISASTYGLHVFFGAIPIVFFFYYRQSSLSIYSPIEISLLAIDGIGFIVLVAYLITFRIWTAKKRKSV